MPAFLLSLGKKGQFQPPWLRRAVVAEEGGPSWVPGRAGRRWSWKSRLNHRAQSWPVRLASGGRGRPVSLLAPSLKNSLGRLSHKQTAEEITAKIEALPGGLGPQSRECLTQPRVPEKASRMVTLELSTEG